jgi:hypothetical protein
MEFQRRSASSNSGRNSLSFSLSAWFRESPEPALSMDKYAPRCTLQAGFRLVGHAPLGVRPLESSGATLAGVLC